jgi:hypothetical protein
MSSFWDVFPILIIFPTFAIMLKWYLDYLTRKRLIDRGLVDEKIKYLYFDTTGRYTPASLKWGLVSLFIGTGIFVVKSLPYRFQEGETFLGVMLIAAGLGLLLYYFIASAARKREQRGRPPVQLPQS